jgi:glutamine transport system substrate-binding protein
MKKWTGFILFIALMMILAACGASDSKKDASGDTGLKELKIATDAGFAPFEFLDGDKVVGFDVDLATAVLEEAGYKAKFEHVGWENMLVQTEKGEADLAVAGISITDERKQSYDFSVPYFESTQLILVPEDSTIESFEDLKDKKVGVQISTTSDEEAARLFGEGSDQIVKFDDVPLAIMSLSKGDVDAVLVDNVVGQEYMKNNPDAGIKGVYDNEAFQSEYYGFMYPKGSELVSEIDAALKKVMENGTYAKIYKEWFGQEPDLTNLQQ